MKKFTLLSLLLCVSLIGFAQRDARQLPTVKHTLPMMKSMVKPVKGLTRSTTANNGVRKAPRKANELVQLPAGATAERYYVDGSLHAYSSNGWVEVAESQLPEINVAFVGNEIYIQGLAYFFEEAWVKGTVNGSVVTIPTGQYVGTDNYGDEYLVGGDTNDNEGTIVKDIVFAYNSENGSLTMDESCYILESDEPNSTAAYTYWYPLTLTKEAPAAPEVVTPPLIMETESWIFTCYEPVFDNEDNVTEEANAITKTVQVGFNGSEIYIQGINPFLPEAWVKGTVGLDGSVTIPTGQYFGSIGSTAMYLVGYGSEGISDMTFTYTDAGMYTANYLMLNLNTTTDVNFYTYYYQVMLLKPSAGPATPVNPEITYFGYDEEYSQYVLSADITPLGTGSEILNGDDLYYKVYTEIDGKQEVYTFKNSIFTRLDSDMTEIPYNFTDDWDIFAGAAAIYFSEDAANFDKIGIQAIYKGGDEVHESEITWYTIKDPTAIQGVSSAKAAEGRVFDLQGRAVKSPAKGLYIKNGRKFMVK